MLSCGCPNEYVCPHRRPSDPLTVTADVAAALLELRREGYTPSDGMARSLAQIRSLAVYEG